MESQRLQRPPRPSPVIAAAAPGAVLIAPGTGAAGAAAARAPPGWHVLRELHRGCLPRQMRPAQQARHSWMGCGATTRARVRARCGTASQPDGLSQDFGTTHVLLAINHGAELHGAHHVHPHLSGNLTAGPCMSATRPQVNTTTKKRTRRESAVWADVRHAVSALSHPAPVVAQLTL